jgi:hypothetical protein
VQKTDVSKSDDDIEKRVGTGRVCPTCGTCPTCGAKKQEAAPIQYVPYYIPPQPYVWPQPYTITFETTLCAGANPNTYYNVPAF